MTRPACEFRREIRVTSQEVPDHWLPPSDAEAGTVPSFPCSTEDILPKGLLSCRVQTCAVLFACIGGELHRLISRSENCGPNMTTESTS